MPPSGGHPEPTRSAGGASVCWSIRTVLGVRGRVEPVRAHAGGRQGVRQSSGHPPLDRLIVAHADLRRAALLTKDALILARYGRAGPPGAEVTTGYCT